MKIAIGIIMLIFSPTFCYSQLVFNSAIRVNQVGYYTNQIKEAVVAGKEQQNFHIIRVGSLDTVFSGTLEPAKFYEKADEYYMRANFTDLRKKGDFFLAVEGLGRSYKFSIADHLYSTAIFHSTRTFFFQRASMALEEKYAGIFARKAGHPDTNLRFIEVPGKTENCRHSSPGGWYDAGDYGKYMVNSGITTATMMAIYELFPQDIHDNFLNIPESGNGKPDLLDEIKYQMDWILTMQDSDGGVFFKLGPVKWPGYVMPADDHGERFIIGKSTSSTLNFAAVAAMAYRVFKNHDPKYAKKCLEAAKRAWIWANQNPEVQYPVNREGTGPYSDGPMRDEFLWAATELMISTGERKYIQYVMQNIENVKIQPNSWWQDVSNLTYYSIITHQEKLPKKLVEHAKKSILDMAELVRKETFESPQRIFVRAFHWGSNSNLLNAGILLAYAYLIDKNRENINAIILFLDYIFGVNPLAKSFVSGFGENPLMNPHLRPTAADNIDHPMPGYIAGGPNETLAGGDPYLVAIHARGTPGAKAYVDVVGSWASNEIAINWNAPFTFILFFIEKKVEGKIDPTPERNIRSFRRLR